MFFFPSSPTEVQCCELLWITFAQERGCRLWTLMSCPWTLSYLPSRACLPSAVCRRMSGRRDICSKELRRFVTSQHCFQVLACKLAKPFLATGSLWIWLYTWINKQQEGEKRVGITPLSLSEEATSKAISLPLRAVPGLSLSRVKLPEQAALWKAIFLKLVHNTAAPLLHKSGPKRNI